MEAGLITSAHAQEARAQSRGPPSDQAGVLLLQEESESGFWIIAFCPQSKRDGGWLGGLHMEAGRPGKRLLS